MYLFTPGYVPYVGNVWEANDEDYSWEVHKLPKDRNSKDPETS